MQLKFFTKLFKIYWTKKTKKSDLMEEEWNKNLGSNIFTPTYWKREKVFGYVTYLTNHDEWW